MRKRIAGDAIDIRAADYNEMVEAAAAHTARQLSVMRGVRTSRPRAECVLVQNVSGQTVPRFGVLGIDGPVIPPATNANEFQNRLAIRGVTPETAHQTNFVITAEPIRHNAFGNGFIAGATQALVEMVSPEDAYALAWPGEVGKLISSTSGPLQILWADTATQPNGASFAIARFGAPAGFGGTAVIVQVNDNAFTCQDLDIAGNPIGDTYPVYALTYPALDGRYDQQSLALCDPQRQAGDLLRIEWREQYVGDGQTIAGWWTVQDFTLFGCLRSGTDFGQAGVQTVGGG